MYTAWQSDFAFDAKLLISDRNKEISISAQAQQGLVDFVQGSKGFQEFKLGSFTAKSCANNAPGEFVSGGHLANKAAQSLTTWIGTLVPIIPHARVCENEKKELEALDKKFDKFKVSINYPAPNFKDKDDKKLKAWWAKFCAANPLMARGGGKTVENVQYFLQVRFVWIYVYVCVYICIYRNRCMYIYI